MSNQTPPWHPESQGQPQGPVGPPQQPGYPSAPGYPTPPYPQYYPPPYPPPVVYPPVIVTVTPTTIVPQPGKGDGSATTALVMGIFSFLLSLPSLIPVIGIFCAAIWLPMAIMGLIFGFLGLRSRAHRGAAIAGLILTALGLAPWIALWTLIAQTTPTQ